MNWQSTGASTDNNPSTRAYAASGIFGGAGDALVAVGAVGHRLWQGNVSPSGRPTLW